MKGTMIRKHPLDITPELVDVQERPLDLNEIKKKGYPNI